LAVANGVTMREEASYRIKTRYRLWKEQNETCAYCDKKIPYDKASLDHIIPVFHMEEISGPENLIVSCKKCNKNKGNMIVYTNLYDRVIYPIVDAPYVFYDYYIHSTKKITR
jgi:CRISPR/Cas system Type II protein with McrA/HNH and RuvC-like nuclease domain